MISNIDREVGIVLSVPTPRYIGTRGLRTYLLIEELLDTHKMVLESLQLMLRDM